VRKAVFLQMQAMSVVAQPVDPKLETAQLRAQEGSAESWAEAKVRPEATAKTTEYFILNVESKD